MKPLKCVLLLVALHPVAPLFAQFDFPALYGAGPALGGMSVALNDKGSLISSLAGLASLEDASVAVSLRREFLSDGMDYAAASAALPSPAGCWAASIIHYGGSDYNEQRLSLAYALPALGRMSAAIAFHYLHSGTSDPYYNKINLFTFSAALRYSPSDELTVGLKAYNPLAVRIDAKNGYRTPAIISLGVSYLLLDELLAAAEVENASDAGTTLRLGVQYTFHDSYFFRMGYNSTPAIYTFGIGMKLSHFSVDIAAQFHNTLGITPTLSLLYSF